MVTTRKLGLVGLEEDITLYIIDVPNLNSLGYKDARVILSHNEENDELYAYIQPIMTEHMKLLGMCFVGGENIHPLINSIQSIDFSVTKQLNEAKEIISKAILLKHKLIINTEAA